MARHDSGLPQHLIPSLPVVAGLNDPAQLHAVANSEAVCGVLLEARRVATPARIIVLCLCIDCPRPEKVRIVELERRIGSLGVITPREEAVQHVDVRDRLDALVERGERDGERHWCGKLGDNQVEVRISRACMQSSLHCGSSPQMAHANARAPRRPAFTITRAWHSFGPLQMTPLISAAHSVPGEGGTRGTLAMLYYTRTLIPSNR